MSDRYGKFQSLAAIMDAILAAAVMGLVCLALYFADLSLAWHLTVIICASVVLLALLIAHGIQGIISQIHLSCDYIARVIMERDTR